MENSLFYGKNIIKHYPRSNFKLDISEVDLLPNSIIGVVGENGNGKTTLLNIIVGNLDASFDSRLYFGKSPKSIKDWIQVKDRIAFIPQRIPKWYGSLKQNLMLKAALENIPSDKIDKELDEILEFLGLTKYAHLKWSEISSGYRLRFELARILIGKPQLLVLDEPIANLDINAQQKFLSDLKRIVQAKEYSVAVILSSQQLHEIEAVADHMIFIKQGKSVFSGNVENLLGASNTIEILVKKEASFENWLSSSSIEFKKNGVYFQVDIGTKSSNDFLTELIANKFEIEYYRNISKSTKKLF